MRVLLPSEAKAMNAARIRKGPRNARAMFVEVQQLLLKDIRDPKTTPANRAKCAQALEKLEERLRILNGKPLPGQLRPDLDQKKSKRRPAILSMPEVAPEPSNVPKTSEGIS